MEKHCRVLLLKVLSQWGSQTDVPELELLALALEGNALAYFAPVYRLD